MTIENELIDVTKYENKVVALFEDNTVKTVTTQLVEYCEKVVHDITDEKGRTELKRFVARIRKSSKLLDDLGKEHTAKLKALPKVVDKSRKDMRDRLEQLASDVRQPLTDWESAEEKRKSDILARINAIDPFQGGIISILPGERSTDALKDLAEKTSLFVVDDSLEEYQGQATKTKDDVILKLSGLIAIQMQQEAQAAALEKQRIEQEEQARIKREKAIAIQAAKDATMAAEKKAQQEKKDALVRETQAIEAAEKAKRDQIASEERAKIEQEQAVQAEKDRQEQELKAQQAKEEAERKAAEKKAANKKHRAAINSQAAKDLRAVLMAYDTGEQTISPGQAKILVEAIFNGKISNVTINY